MTELFIRLLNMSLTAVYLILAILLVRAVAGKIPRKYICLLWALAGIRLTIPFEFESLTSLIPSGRIVTSSIMTDQTPEINSGITVVDKAVNTALTGSAPDMAMSANPMQIYMGILALLWIVGVAFMALLCFISYERLNYKLINAKRLQGRIYQSGEIDTPFVLGFFRPKIYVPASMGESDKFVIAHEEAHIKRLDNLTKPLAYFILMLHWFNPLVWAAFILYCRDVELACDENVVKNMTVDERKEYSNALLNCSVKQSAFSICPLAFGEIGVKDRIYNVLHFSRPTKKILAITMVIVFFVVICLMSSPVSYARAFDQGLEQAVSDALLDEELIDGECRAEGHILLGVEEQGTQLKAYAYVSDGEYGFIDNKFVEVSGSGVMPAVLYFATNKDGKYVFKSIQFPEDGDDYAKSLKEMFPLSIRIKPGSYAALKRQKERYAKAYLKAIGREAEVGDYGDFTFKTLEGFSVHVSNALTEEFPSYDTSAMGPHEYFVKGKRMVSEVSSNNKDAVIFQKYEYDTHKVIEKYRVEIKGDQYKIIKEV